jgi:putative SOS response-associated peptidase YedK
MAGIYEDAYFSVMTTAPNKWIKDIHRRMPVVLRSNELDVWLNGDYPKLINRDDIELISSKVAQP